MKKTTMIAMACLMATYLAATSVTHAAEGLCKPNSTPSGTAYQSLAGAKATDSRDVMALGERYGVRLSKTSKATRIKLGAWIQMLDFIKLIELRKQPEKPRMRVNCQGTSNP